MKALIQTLKNHVIFLPLFILFVALGNSLWANNKNWEMTREDFKKYSLNSSASGANQYDPTIAMNSKGNYVIVWTDNRNGSFIYGQLFDSNHQKIGGNFEVSQNTASAMLIAPRVAMLNSGEFMVVWQDKRNNEFDVYGQIFDKNGNAIGQNILVNDDSPGHGQTYPDVAACVDGTFRVVFQDQRSGFKIRGQQFQANSSRVGDNFVVASASWCGNVAIEAFDDGAYLIAWEEAGCFVKKFNSSGYPLSSKIIVTSSGRHPEIAIDGNGNSYIIYQTTTSVLMRRFDENCNKIGSANLVNDSYPNLNPCNANLACDTEGNVVVTWCDYRNDTDDDIWNGGAELYAQQFDNSGNKIGRNVFIQNCTSEACYVDSDITMAANGRVVFTWEDFRDTDTDIYDRIFDGSLAPLNNELMVNDDKNPGGDEPALTIMSSFNSPTANISGLAYDGSNLWVCEYIGSKIYKISTEGSVLTSFSLPSYVKQAQGLGWDGRNLWIADYDGFGTGDMIRKCSPAGIILDSFKAPGDSPHGVEWDGQHLWVVDEATVFKMDTLGNLLASFAAPASDPRGLAWDGMYLWICDFKSSKIYKVTTLGEVVETFDAPGAGPAGLAYDGSTLWYVDFREDRVYRIPIKSTSVSADSWVEAVPKTYVLKQNYPNPFNPTTTIEFDLPHAQLVTLGVYNLLGQKIETLLHENLPAGKHDIKWTAKNLPSGVYLYRLEGSGFSETKKLILQK